MNNFRNRVTLIGNLGQDPEVKTTETGKKYTHFTLATHEGYRNSEGQRITETTWHNIVAWNGLAELAGKNLKKGKQVAVDGRLAYRTYDDKKGVTKYVTEIILSDLVFSPEGKENGNISANEEVFAPVKQSKKKDEE